MSAPQEGMHLAKEAQVMTEKMNPGVITAPPPEGGVQGGAQAVAFPKKFIARDKMDDEMNTKMQLMDKDGMTPFGQVYFDDKAAKWLERKAAVGEAANFDKWFGQNFNKNDLASRQFAQQINPQYYSDREREMAERADVVLRLKGIQLRGPQSKEDLYMQWLIDSGRVKLPKDWDRLGVSVTDQAGYEAVQAQQQKNYAFGLIRMPLFLSSVQRINRAQQNKTVGAWGNGNNASNTFTEGEPPRVNNNRNMPLSRGPAGTLAANMVDALRNQ